MLLSDRNDCQAVGSDYNKILAGDRCVVFLLFCFVLLFLYVQAAGSLNCSEGEKIQIKKKHQTQKLIFSSYSPFV